MIASSGREASQIVDDLFTDIVAVLRRAAEIAARANACTPNTEN